jgi:hypothetical protein
MSTINLRVGRARAHATSREKTPTPRRRRDARARHVINERSNHEPVLLPKFRHLCQELLLFHDDLSSNRVALIASQCQVQELQEQLQCLDPSSCLNRM